MDYPDLKSGRDDVSRTEMQLSYYFIEFPYYEDSMLPSIAIKQRHKNLWLQATCSTCKISYGTEVASFIPNKYPYPAYILLVS